MSQKWIQKRIIKKYSFQTDLNRLLVLVVWAIPNPGITRKSLLANRLGLVKFIRLNRNSSNFPNVG